MTDWREHRKCDHCRAEYRPQRKAQSYCSRECKRAAAYGRERFQAGTKGRRRRRLEASDNALATPLPGSVRNGGFFSMETVASKGGESPQKFYWTVASAGKPLSEVEKAALSLSGFIQINAPQSSRPATFGKLPAEFHHGPTLGALQGDDYQLEYYEDGYPKLPGVWIKDASPNR